MVERAGRRRGRRRSRWSRCFTLPCTGLPGTTTKTFRCPHTLRETVLGAWGLLGAPPRHLGRTRVASTAPRVGVLCVAYRRGKQHIASPEDGFCASWASLASIRVGRKCYAHMHAPLRHFVNLHAHTLKGASAVVTGLYARCSCDLFGSACARSGAGSARMQAGKARSTRAYHYGARSAPQILTGRFLVGRSGGVAHDWRCQFLKL